MCCAGQGHAPRPPRARARAAEWTSIKPTGGELKGKARARQRKEAIMRTVPVHPDIEPAIALLRARGVGHAAAASESATALATD